MPSPSQNAGHALNAAALGLSSVPRVRTWVGLAGSTHLFIGERFQVVYNAT